MLRAKRAEFFGLYRTCDILGTLVANEVKKIVK